MYLNLYQKKYDGFKKKESFSVFRKVCIFITIFLSFLFGASFYGISINKIALVPLLICLILDSHDYNKPLSISCLLYFLFLCLAIVSTFFGYSFSKGLDSALSIEVNQSLTLYLLSIVIFYIPLVFFVSSCKNSEIYYQLFSKYVVIIALINLFWGIIQFLGYYSFGLDVNSVALSFIYPNYSSSLTNIPGLGVFFRPSGLTHDSAIFGIILIFGFAFSKKGFTKFLFFVFSLITLTRSTIVSIVAIAFFDFLVSKEKIKYLLIIFSCICAVLLLMALIPTFSNIFNALIYRFDLSRDLSNDGTNRHISYPFMAIETIFYKADFLESLFGFGPRNSGTALSFFNPSDFSYLMNSKSWTTECDISELLLGNGVLGFICYLLFLISVFVHGDTSLKRFVFGLVVFSFMYNISSSSIINLLFIFASSSSIKRSLSRKKGKEVVSLVLSN